MNMFSVIGIAPRTGLSDTTKDKVITTSYQHIAHQELVIVPDQDSKRPSSEMAAVSHILVLDSEINIQYISSRSTRLLKKYDFKPKSPVKTPLSGVEPTSLTKPELCKHSYNERN